MCCGCMGVTASLRCWQCGPSGYYCPSCFELYHQIVNIFHVADKWEVICIDPFSMSNISCDNTCRMIIMNHLCVLIGALMSVFSIPVRHQKKYQLIVWMNLVSTIIVINYNADSA